MAHVTVGCPHCLSRIQAGLDSAGQVLRCGKCQRLFRLPARRGLTPPLVKPAAGTTWLWGGTALLLVGAGVGLSFLWGSVASAPPNISEPTQVLSAPQLAPEVPPEPPGQIQKDAEEDLPGPKPAVKKLPTPDGPVSPPPVFEVNGADPPQPPPAKAKADVPPVAENLPPKRPEGPIVLAKDLKPIKEAIQRGVKFVKQSQAANGTWGSGYPVGHAGMGGLALLESGVSRYDPAVRKAAAFVRGQAATLNATYELSLAILFLDRLGDPRDRTTIQTFALRLVAGQNHHGGWTYHCPILTPPEELQLITFLRRNQPRPPLNPIAPVMPPFLVPLEKPQGPMPNPLVQNPKEPLLNPLTLKPKDSFLNPLAPREVPLTNPVTNSDSRPDLPNPLPKTQPDPKATGGTDLIQPLPDERQKLGAAKGEPPPMGKPAEVKKPAENQPLPPDEQAPTNNQTPPKPATVLPKARVQPANPRFPADLTVPEFMALLKNPAAVPDKGKGKGKGKFKGAARDDNSNSQFAILGLWAARRHQVPMALTLSLLDERYRGSQAPAGGWCYRYQGGGQTPAMTCVGLLGLGIGHGSFHETFNGKAKRGQDKPAPRFQDPAIQKGLQALSQYLGQPTGVIKGPPGAVDLYFLWSVERVAVLYNLPTIGGKDWYGWGSETLLANQHADGSWRGAYPGVDTCMALLFLGRTNLAQDLTNNLPPYLAVTDPGKK